MNQPHQLGINVDFQGKWGKFTLHTNQYTRTEKYRAWKKVSHCRIHSRRQPSHNRTGKSHLNASTDSGTFINCGQGMGYPPKIFVGSHTDKDIPPPHSNYRKLLQDMSDQKGQMFLQAHV